MQDACIDLLISCGRLPEAAFFARTYAPSRMTEVVKLWQGDLAKINPKAAESLANPDVRKMLRCCHASAAGSSQSGGKSSRVCVRLEGLDWLRQGALAAASPQAA